MNGFTKQDLMGFPEAYGVVNVAKELSDWLI